MQLNFKISFHPKYVTPIPSAHDHARTEKAKREKEKKKKQEKEKKQLEKEEKRKLKKKRKNDNLTPVGILVNPVVTEDDQQFLVANNTMAATDGMPHVHSMDEKPNLENGGAAIVSDNDSDLDRTELVPKQTAASTNEMALSSDDNEYSSDDDLGEQVSPSHTSGNNF